MMGAKSHADKSSGPAEPSLPHQQAVDMTAPETFTTAPRQPLTKGRRPDMTAICAQQPIRVTALDDRNSFFAMFRRRLEQRPLRTNFALPRDAGRQVSESRPAIRVAHAGRCGKNPLIVWTNTNHLSGLTGF